MPYYIGGTFLWGRVPAYRALEVVIAIVVVCRKYPLQSVAITAGSTINSNILVVERDCSSALTIAVEAGPKAGSTTEESSISLYG